MMFFVAFRPLLADFCFNAGQNAIAGVGATVFKSNMEGRRCLGFASVHLYLDNGRPLRRAYFYHSSLRYLLL